MKIHEMMMMLTMKNTVKDISQEHSGFVSCKIQEKENIELEYLEK